MRITDPSRPSHIRAFDLVFFLPDGMETPQSLHQALLLYTLQDGQALSITRRVRIAQELARSINYVHTFNFVHKSISSESVLLVPACFAAFLA
jgi:serine/threonine protein kinase